MPDQYVTIESVSGRQEAEFIKAYMNAEGIKCELSQEAGGAFGFSVGGLARVDIMVPSKQVSRARRALRNYEKSKG
jgi:hypothetical protein